jgi:hypothetical protein
MLRSDVQHIVCLKQLVRGGWRALRLFDYKTCDINDSAHVVAANAYLLKRGGSVLEVQHTVCDITDQTVDRNESLVTGSHLV